MKVSVLGDLFLTNEVLEAAFVKAFQDSGIDFEFSHLTNRWPVIPVQATDEISEFVGDPDEVAWAVVEAEVILTHSAPITRKVVDSAPRLLVVGAARGGPVNINWAACTERGIPVLYAPGRNSGAVAEFTVGMMLAQSRNITRAHMSLMTEKRWRGDLYVLDSVGNELSRSVVGLVGLGAIGGKVARLVSAFGARVLVYDPLVSAEPIHPLGYEPVSLDDLLSHSDFVSLHARLTKQTRGMIGDREIRLMRPKAYLINTARGELVQHAALYAALQEGRIAGAALDLFEAEPPPDDSPLFQLDNLTATSHLAGASIQAAEIGATVLAQGVYDYLVRKEPPKYCVNPEFAQHVSPQRG